MKTLAILILGVLLAGCAATSGIEPREILPTEQQTAATLHASADADSQGLLPSQSWWQAYKDPELNRWIETGLASNPGMREATARLEQVQALFAITRGNELPSLGASADSTAQRISGTGIFPPPLAGMIHTVNNVDLVASFELDLFGALAAQTEQARQSAQAAAIDAQAVRIRLAAAIGHAYFDLARAQQSLRIAREIESTREKTLNLVQRRVQAGLDTRVERELALETVPEIRVDIARAQEQIELARHSLAVLAGQEPHAADAVEAHLPEDAMLTRPVEISLDLVSRRTDVAAARRRALAAASAIKAARAQFYPNINLSAIVGLNSLTTQRLFEANSRTWQVGPAVHLPIFEGGALRAQLRAADARSDEAVDAYEGTILKAAGEVADALTSIAAIDRQRTQQHLATEHAQSASELATVRYEAGLGNYLTVLASQSAVLAQRRAQLDLDARAAAMDISLALALGGGYRGDQAP